MLKTFFITLFLSSCSLYSLCFLSPLLFRLSFHFLCFLSFLSSCPLFSLFIFSLIPSVFSLHFLCFPSFLSSFPVFSPLCLHFLSFLFSVFPLSLFIFSSLFSSGYFVPLLVCGPPHLFTRISTQLTHLCSRFRDTNRTQPSHSNSFGIWPMTASRSVLIDERGGKNIYERGGSEQGVSSREVKAVRENGDFIAKALISR